MALARCEGGEPAKPCAEAAHAASSVTGVIEGSRWLLAEESLRKALAAQGMAPEE